MGNLGLNGNEIMMLSGAGGRVIIPLLFAVVVIVLIIIYGTGKNASIFRGYPRVPLMLGTWVFVLLFLGMYTVWSEVINILPSNMAMSVNLFMVLSMGSALAAGIFFVNKKHDYARNLVISAFVFGLPLLFLVPIGWIFGFVWIFAYELILLGALSIMPRLNVLGTKKADGSVVENLTSTKVMPMSESAQTLSENKSVELSPFAKIALDDTPIENY